MKKIYIIIICCLQYFSVFAEFKSIKQQIEEIDPQQFKQISLFEKVSISPTFQNLETHISNFDLVKSNPNTLKEISHAAWPQITLKILVNGQWENMHLIKNDAINENIHITTQHANNKESVSTQLGAYYYGIFDNIPNATIAISFFDDNIMGLIISDQGNIVIGKSNLEKPIQNEYIIYNDQMMKDQNTINCASNDLHLFKPKNQSPNYVESITLNCVKIYFECDYHMYQSFGNNITNTTNYVTGLFNMVSTLYLNDSISTSISQINIWTSIDPYASFSTTDSMLTSFSNQMSTGFNGDLAHLLSTRNAGGGIAWIDVFCAPNYYKTGLSASLSTTLTPLPTYSWNTEVLTHELGHNMGSPHTHACAWNGNNTRIDNCAGNFNINYQEGTCNSFPPNPPGGGTIMSYCHLQAVGINFNNGFGPQPGALIRNNVNTAPCLLPCNSCDGNVSITGVYAIALTESSSWISTTGQTTILSTANIKLDADPTSGYILMEPSNNNDFFLAEASNNTAQFIAQAYNGCTTGEPQRPILPNSLLSNQQNDNRYFIYPNPAFSILNMKQVDTEKNTFSYSIYSVEGRELLAEKNIIMDDHYSIAIQHLAPGFYMIKIFQNDRVELIKFQKQ